MRLTAYCLDWHITSSDAFVDLLVEPLKPYISIKLTPWDGHELPSMPNPDDPLIFCMIPPSEKILKNCKQKIIWFPMWDQALGFEEKWWNALPDNLHVVAFSDVVYQKSVKAGLKTLKLKYYKNPNNFRPASWDDGRVIFYWNRTGLLDRVFLEKLCTSIGAKKLLFRSQLDPRIDRKHYYELPQKLGDTEVVNIQADTREGYLKKIEPANIFISPRAREGAGMTLLESMARGCTPIANNEPTMSEYILQNINGILLDYSGGKPTSKITRFFAKNESSRDLPIHQINEADQNWDKLARIDFHRLGDRARSDCQAGYSQWVKSIPEYADFILSDQQ